MEHRKEEFPYSFMEGYTAKHQEDVNECKLSLAQQILDKLDELQAEFSNRVKAIDNLTRNWSTPVFAKENSKLEKSNYLIKCQN